MPTWELRKEKEEVKYVLKVCRGVPQNDAHDVSVCLTPMTKEIYRVMDSRVCKKRKRESCVFAVHFVRGD